MTKKTLAFGIFCYFSSLIFLIIGGSMTVYLIEMFFNAENGVMVASILLPFSIIFIIMAVAVFKLGGRVLNASQHGEDTEETEV